MSPAESLLRQLPSVDELLGRPSLAERCRELPRALVAEAVREALQATRAAIERDPRPELVTLERLEQTALGILERWQQPSLRPVINATGVLLHTNLGRAPLGAHAGARWRSRGFARRADRDRRGLSHSRHHAGQRSPAARGGHDESHPAGRL